MENIKVVLWGLGSMGSGMARYLVEKKGIEITGAVAGRSSKAGKDLGELLELDQNLGVEVTNDPLQAINPEVDVVLHATTSFIDESVRQLQPLIERGINIISIAEEMAYPRATNKELAVKLDELAKENGASVLGTGINPGFVLDLLIINLSGACARVDKIEASRVNDLSPFGPTVMSTQGVGTTVEEFEKGLKENTIVGHIGFPQSIEMIADSTGLKIDTVEQTREPIISSTYRETPHVEVEPGMVAGCRHIARGLKDGEEIIVLEHPQQIHPDLEGTETGDYIKISGEPDINMAIKPEIPGGIGTMAVAINMIPRIVRAEAGLLSMKDLPVPTAIMGDARELLNLNSSN